MTGQGLQDNRLEPPTAGARRRRFASGGRVANFAICFLAKIFIYKLNECEVYDVVGQRGALIGRRVL